MKGHLPGVLKSLAPLFAHYGYVTVFVALAGIGIPVPGEAVLAGAAVYAHFGKLNIFSIIIVEIIATIVGNSLGYVIGRFGGSRFIAKFGRFIFINEKRLKKAQSFLDGHGAKVVIAAPFIEGLRQTMGIIAGTSDMAWRTYLLFNVIGAFIWVGVWTAAGYFSGSYITIIYKVISQYLIFIPITLLVVFGVLVVRKHLTAKHNG